MLWEVFYNSFAACFIFPTKIFRLFESFFIGQIIHYTIDRDPSSHYQKGGPDFYKMNGERVQISRYYADLLSETPESKHLIERAEAAGFASIPTSPNTLQRSWNRILVPCANGGIWFPSRTLIAPAASLNTKTNSSAIPCLKPPRKSSG